MNKNVVPNDFTLGLALFDGLPVITFAGSMILISYLFSSKLFLIGSFFCLFAGLSKVIWKIIVVLKNKNIWFFFIQMRITMPIGFLLILISLFVERNKINFSTIINSVLSMPCLLFFIVGVVGMVLMFVFAFVLDGSKSKNNWIEQITNFISQLSFFIGILLITIK